MDTGERLVLEASGLILPVGEADGRRAVPPCIPLSVSVCEKSVLCLDGS